MVTSYDPEDRHPTRERPHHSPLSGEREQLKGPAAQGVNTYEGLSEIADGDLIHWVLVALITGLELTYPLFGYRIAGINLM